MDTVVEGDELEEALYLLRRSTQADILAAGGAIKEESYFASLSSRTITHKGMVQSCILGQFYGDLTNPLFKTNFAIYHRRFSTNTVPKWPLAQPMRCLAHNGQPAPPLTFRPTSDGPRHLITTTSDQPM